MITLDITKTNQAVRNLLDRTESCRHRFLLMAYDRHRNLEMAGRYEEILAPDMMVEEPVYHLHANGLRVKLQGQCTSTRARFTWSGPTITAGA
jgi:hypothetical protein